MQIFEVSTIKELQHFLYFLERAESGGLDLPSLYKYTKSYVDKTIADIAVQGTTVPEKVPMPEDFAGFNDKCRDCGLPLRLMAQPEMDGSMIVIAECRACFFSKIVGPADG